MTKGQVETIRLILQRHTAKPKYPNPTAAKTTKTDTSSKNEEQRSALSYQKNSFIIQFPITLYTQCQR